MNVTAEIDGWHQPQQGYRHEALFYAGEAQFVSDVSSFIRDGLEADDVVLVVVGAHKLGWLRDALGSDAGAVRFADMADVGKNPGRIISAWHDFVDEHAGRSLRGVGEPIYPERTPDELFECQLHEALLNPAFADASSFWLACPYDTEALDPEVVHAARQSHPVVGAGAGDAADHRTSHWYRDDVALSMFQAPLPVPPADAIEVEYTEDDLGAVRDLVGKLAATVSLGEARTDDLVLAVNELAGNSIRHGGGAGTLRVWRDGTTIVCEVRDAGRIDNPLVGRRRPTLEQSTGRGLWLANQLCDLVQLRSSPAGLVARLHMHGA